MPAGQGRSGEGARCARPCTGEQGTRAPRARRPSMWAHGCVGTMRGREQGRAPRPSPPIRPGGALTHRTGCTEVRGTFPRLGNHRRSASDVALSPFMRQAILGYPGDRENSLSDHRGPQRGRHAQTRGIPGPPRRSRGAKSDRPGQPPPTGGGPRSSRLPRLRPGLPKNLTHPQGKPAHPHLLGALALPWRSACPEPQVAGFPVSGELPIPAVGTCTSGRRTGHPGPGSASNR